MPFSRASCSRTGFINLTYKYFREKFQKPASIRTSTLKAAAYLL